LTSHPTEPSPGSSRKSTLTTLLIALSIALLVGFATTVVLGLIPPRLLDPTWQLRLCSLLIENAGVAGVGLGLLHLAAYLDRDNPQLQRRLQDLRHWAAAAALGFLLLIPLQGLAVARGLNNASLTQDRQLRQVDRTLEQLRQSIRSAPDVASLQRRIPASMANNVGTFALQQPLPELRAQLLDLIDTAQNRAKSSRRTPTPESLWPLIQSTLRVLVTAPVYAVAFAAMSVNVKKNESLLDQIWLSWRRRRLRNNRRWPYPQWFKLPWLKRSRR
jgi:hypothetical protein